MHARLHSHKTFYFPSQPIVRSVDGVGVPSKFVSVCVKCVLYKHVHRRRFNGDAAASIEPIVFFF